MLLISEQAPSRSTGCEERTIVGRGVRVGGRRMLRGENKDVTATSLSGGCKITVERKQNSKEGREGNK